MPMMSIIFIMFALFSLLLTVGVGVLIGVLVYKDATKKEMPNPILWALLAVFAPSFIGLIIYFIVRSSYPKTNPTYYNQTQNVKKMTCSFCGSTVQSDYVNCPHCGTILKKEQSSQETNF